MLEALHLKCELIEGELVDVSPMKPRHAVVTINLSSIFNELLSRTTHAVGSQTPVVLSDISEPEPDVWVAHVGLRAFLERKPEPADLSLVVEVSDTTLRFDRDVKVPMYASAGVSNLWIVDINADQIVSYGNPVDGDYRSIGSFTTEDAIPLPWGGELSVATILLLDLAD